MFVAANPDKGKTEEDKADMRKKYKPGDDILPKVEAKEKTLRERRVEDEDRRLMNEVRDQSLREVGVEVPERAAGTAGIRRTGSDADGELLLLSEEGNETMLACDQTLYLPRIGGEGGVTRKLAGEDTKKPAVRQQGKLSISLL
jgi:hypothetical protein